MKLCSSYHVAMVTVHVSPITIHIAVKCDTDLNLVFWLSHRNLNLTILCTYQIHMYVLAVVAAVDFRGVSHGIG